MKMSEQLTTNEHFTDECLNLLLDEAERAILQVESRADEPGRRLVHGDVPDRDLVRSDVSELRLAISELVDAYPSIQHDLESIGERLRNVGVTAGIDELEAHPHVLDLVRMSLEIFFVLNPTADAFEAEHRRQDDTDESATSPQEVFDAYVQLLALLRARLS
jgi:hypothetical protein